jgi:hypothetical protein
MAFRSSSACALLTPILVRARTNVLCVFGFSSHELPSICGYIIIGTQISGT